jgi:hypothetical protein
VLVNPPKTKKNTNNYTTSEEDLAQTRQQPPALQPGSHPSLDSLSGLFLASNPNEFVRQPPDVRASFGSYILRTRRAVFKSSRDGIDTVDQDLLRSTQDDDSFDDFVQIGEPVFW